MLLNELKKLVITALEDLKGRNINVLDVANICDFTDAMVFCSGTSTRHVQSLADNVIDVVKNHQIRPIGVEGMETGDWVLVDLGDLVVHVMLPETRDLYQLEQLWSIQPEAKVDGES